MIKNSSLTQVHLLNVSIGFHYLHLIVKFPCDIVLILKTHDNKFICQAQPRPLLNGRCQINQHLELEWHSAYDVGRSQYIQTSMEIVVMVNSINGNIQAGNCFIDVSRIHSKSTVALKKCSDKSASLCLSTNFEFRKVIQEKEHIEMQKDGSPILNTSLNHSIKRMRSVEILQKNQDSQLSISKITVSNKRLQHFLRAQKEQIQRQNEILQGKLKISERKQKQLMLQLRQALMKYEKLSNRSSSLENSSQISQFVCQQKDKAIKSLEAQLRNRDLKIKDFNEQYINLQSRLEAKQHNYQQQISKICEKNSILNAQIQQLTQNQSNLLSRYEVIQKNAQGLLKQRDKNYNLQKSKWSKSLTEKQKEMKQIEQERNQYRQKYADLQTNYSRLKQKLQQLENNDRNDEYDELKKQNGQIKMVNKQLVEQIEQLKKVIQERVPFRRRMNELQSDNNNMKIQLQKSHNMLMINEEKTRQLMKRIQQWQWQSKSNKEKYQQLDKRYININNKYHQLEKQHLHFKQSYQKIQEVLKEVKDKKEQNELRLRQQFIEWGKQVELLAAEKIRLQDQNKDLKWQLQQFEEGLRQSHSSIDTTKTQIFELKQQLLVNSEKQQQYKAKIDLLEKQLDETKADHETSSAKMRQLQNKMNQLMVQLSNGSKEISRLSLKLDEVQIQNERLVYTVKQQKEKKQDRILELEQTLRLTEYENHKLEQRMQIKQQELSKNKQKITNIQENIKTIIEENQNLNNQNIKISSDISHRQSQIKFCRDTIKKLTYDFTYTKQGLSGLRNEYLTLKDDYETYKQANADVVRWLLCILGEQQQITEQSIKYFGENNLKNLQKQAIKNRNLWLLKIKRQMNSIKEQKDFLQSELEKIGQQLLSSTNQYEHLLDLEKNERLIMAEQLIMERQNLLSELNKIKTENEQLRVMNDNYYKQIKLCKLKIQQLQQEREVVNESKLQLQHRLEENEHEVVFLADKNTKLMRQVQQMKLKIQKSSALMNEEQRKRYQQQQLFLSNKIKSRQEQIQLKQQKIKHLQQRCIIVQNEARKIQFLLTVKQQLLLQIQRKYEQSNKNRMQLQTVIKQFQTLLDRRQKDMLQKQYEVIECNNRRQQMRIRYNECMVRIKQLQQQVSQYHSKLEHKIQQLRQSRSKHRQYEQAAGKMKDQTQKKIINLQGQLIISKIITEKSQQTIKQLYLNLHRLQSDLENKKQMIQRLSSDRQIIQKQVLFEQSEQNTLMRQFEQLTQNYQHAKSEIYLLYQQKLKLEQEIQNLILSNKEKQRKIEETMENSRLRVVKEISDLRRKNEQQGAKIGKLEAKCQQLNQDIVELRMIIQKKQFLLLMSEQQKQRIRCQFEEQIQRIGRNQQKMHERIEQMSLDHREERQQLIRQIQHSNQECMQLKQLIRQKDIELQQTLRQQDTSLRRIQYLQSQIKQAQSPIDMKHNDELPESLKSLMNDLSMKQSSVEIHEYNYEHKD